jgi:hypothetical protein
VANKTALIVAGVVVALGAAAYFAHDWEQVGRDAAGTIVAAKRTQVDSSSSSTQVRASDPAAAAEAAKNAAAADAASAKDAAAASGAANGKKAKLKNALVEENPKETRR